MTEESVRYKRLHSAAVVPMSIVAAEGIGAALKVLMPEKVSAVAKVEIIKPSVLGRVNVLSVVAGPVNAIFEVVSVLPVVSPESNIGTSDAPVVIVPTDTFPVPDTADHTGRWVDEDMDKT